jgi:hypothetical protein
MGDSYRPMGDIDGSEVPDLESRQKINSAEIPASNLVFSAALQE